MAFPIHTPCPVPPPHYITAGGGTRPMTWDAAIEHWDLCIPDAQDDEGPGTRTVLCVAPIILSDVDVIRDIHDLIMARSNIQTGRQLRDTHARLVRFTTQIRRAIRELPNGTQWHQANTAILQAAVLTFVPHIVGKLKLALQMYNAIQLLLGMQLSPPIFDLVMPRQFGKSHALSVAIGCAITCIAEATRYQIVLCAQSATTAQNNLASIAAVVTLLDGDKIRNLSVDKLKVVNVYKCTVTVIRSAGTENGARGMNFDTAWCDERMFMTAGMIRHFSIVSNPAQRLQFASSTPGEPSIESRIYMSQFTDKLRKSNMQQQLMYGMLVCESCRTKPDPEQCEHCYSIIPATRSPHCVYAKMTATAGDPESMSRVRAELLGMQMLVTGEAISNQAVTRLITSPHIDLSALDLQFLVRPNALFIVVDPGSGTHSDTAVFAMLRLNIQHGAGVSGARLVIIAVDIFNPRHTTTQIQRQVFEEFIQRINVAFPGLLQRVHTVPWVEGNGGRTMARDINEHILAAVNSVGGLGPLPAVYSSEAVMDAMGTTEHGVFITQTAAHSGNGPTKPDGLVLLQSMIAEGAIRFAQGWVTTGIESFMPIDGSAQAVRCTEEPHAAILNKIAEQLRALVIKPSGDVHGKRTTYSLDDGAVCLLLACSVIGRANAASFL